MGFPHSLIWQHLRSELISCFDLNQRSNAAELALANYRYSNESADAYINKVRELTRTANGSATEAQIVKNLYSHLPDYI